MSVILAVSILIRVCAFAWSIVIAIRYRDIRVLVLTLMFALMAARQIMTMTLDPPWTHTVQMAANLDEVPGLLVSLIGLVIVAALPGLLRRRRDEVLEPSGDANWKGKRIVPVLVIGVMSSMGILLVGYFAYLNSRQAILQTVADQNLALGRTVSEIALTDLDENSVIDRKDAIKEIENAWRQIQFPYQNTYLCVVGSSGEIELHTAKPNLVGTNVGEIDASENHNGSVNDLLSSQSSYSGQNTSLQGENQLVGYYYEPRLESLVAVHIPVSTVEAGFGNAAAPWFASIVLIGGLLLPVSLVMLFQSSRQASGQAMRSLTALRDSEEQARSLIVNSPICIHEIDMDGRLLSINPAGLEMMGLSDVTEICGLKYVTAVREEDRLRIQELLDRAFEGESSHFEFQTPEGQSFKSCFVPLKHPSNRVYRIMGITEDVTDRKQAEAELRLRDHALTSCAHGVTIVDAIADDYPLIYCNPGFERQTGYTKEEMIGKNMRFLQRDDRDQMGLEVFRRAVAEEEPASVTLRNYRKDGSMFWNEVHLSPVRDPDGRVIQFIAFQYDVTARVQAENARKESEANLADAERRARLGSWSINPETEATWWSSEMYRLHHIPIRDEAPSPKEHINQLVHPDDRQALRDFEKTLFAKRSNDRIEFRTNPELGDVRYLSATTNPRYDDDGKFLGLAGTLLDITELKTAEQQIVESRERYRKQLAELELVYRTAPVGLCLMGTDLRYQRVNEHLAYINAKPLQDHIGRHIREVRPDVAEELIPLYEKVIKTGQPVVNREVERLDPDGGREKQHYLVSYYRLNDEQENVIGVSSVVQDITGMKRAAKELHELNASLEARVADRTNELAETNAELNSFAHSVSHDLKAPLRAIEGFSTALLEDYGEQIEETGREYVDYMLSAVKHMDTLINDLLAYSQLGRAEIRLEQLDLNALVEQAIEQMRPEIERRHATITVAPDLPQVFAHRSTLVQVVTNLISNATKFVESTKRPDVRIRAEFSTKGRVRIWVEDNGVGIKEENQQRIFQVFERLHGVESYPGTGIGLAIVVRACNRLNGRYGVESELGKGSRFWVEFAGANETAAVGNGSRHL